MRRHLLLPISLQLLGNQGKLSKINLFFPHLCFKAEALKTVLTQARQTKMENVVASVQESAIQVF